jgi:hypothetical protein
MCTLSLCFLFDHHTIFDLLSSTHTFWLDGRYSFGVFLWEVFARERPFHGVDLMEVAAGVYRKGDRVPLVNVRPV